jgi:hypothetical protein
MTGNTDILFFLIPVSLLLGAFLWSLWEKRKRQFLRFTFFEQEEILFKIPQVRRRIYYWGRFELRVLEERLDLYISSHRFFFTRKNTLCQVVDFTQNQIPPSASSIPYFFCSRHEIRILTPNPTNATTTTTTCILQIPFLSLTRQACFEVLDLPQEKIQFLLLPPS